MTGVAAVVPNWNRQDLLSRLLQDLRTQTHPLADLVVVDNGSDDGSVAVAERLGARVVRMGRNVGFSRAVNRGIRESRAEWVAILNNDVELAPDWLERLAEAARNSGAWFASGKIYRQGSMQVIDASFDALSRGGSAWRCGQGRPDGPAWNVPRRIRFAPMTAGLFRRKLFEVVGFLDEDFESYMEDVEFGLRCALRGCEGVYVPEAVAHHLGSATLGAWHGDTVRRISRNQALLIAKHYPDRWMLQFGWPVLVAQLLWGFVALRHRAGLPWLLGKMEAFRSFRRLRPGRRSGEKLSAVLEESEREIRTLQEQTGFDWYWRLYFVLT